MVKAINKTDTKRSLLAPKIAGVIFLVLVLSFVGAFLAYAKEFESVVLPNTFLLDQDISKLNKDQLKEKVNKISEEKKLNELKIVFEDRSWEMKFSDVGWSLKSDQIAEEAYGYGHSDNNFINFINLALSRVGKRNIKPQFDFNESQTTSWVLGVNSQIGTPKREANIQVKNKKAKIIEPSSGKEIDHIFVNGEIYKRLSLEKAGDIGVALVESTPIISREEAEALSDKAIDLSSQEIKLIGPGAETTWSQNTIGNIIEIKKDEEKSGFLNKPTYSDAYVSFSENKILSLLENESENLNIEPVEARFTVVNGEVTIQSPSKDGTIVDLGIAPKQIIKSLQDGKEKTIKLPVKTQGASIQARVPSDIAKFGIKELIGTGSTTFNGSSSNRVHNIKVGTKAVSGVLLKPGDEFSTTGQLGKIDASTGYLQELVIKENKTIPEFGGGLCQVATTLFRAALNSGLKITERHNHAYRVSYYEPPVGMDATIYSPSPDFKFVNDTESYILIQGRVEGYKAIFDFYGTKDGREIEISNPYVYDERPAPEPIYIDDPSLAPGEEKRIDRAHSGAKASFTYKVKKDGRLISDQKFNSSYVPWPAKYLRGPAQAEEGEQQSQ